MHTETALHSAEWLVLPPSGEKQIFLISQVDVDLCSIRFVSLGLSSPALRRLVLETTRAMLRNQDEREQVCYSFFERVRLLEFHCATLRFRNSPHPAGTARFGLLSCTSWFCRTPAPDFCHVLIAIDLSREESVLCHFVSQPEEADVASRDRSECRRGSTHRVAGTGSLALHLAWLAAAVAVRLLRHDALALGSRVNEHAPPFRHAG